MIREPHFSDRDMGFRFCIDIDRFDISTPTIVHKLLFGLNMQDKIFNNVTKAPRGDN